VRIVFMGTPSFAGPALRLLKSNGYEIAAVYTQPDRPAGRGCKVSFSPVKQIALELGLKVVQPVSLKKEEAFEELKSFAPDAIVVAAFGQILNRAVLDLPRYGCVNIHPSMLPKYRGAVPVAASLLNGDSFTGVSIMLMDEGLDTGPVLSQAQIPIQKYDNMGVLTDKLAFIGACMLLETLPDWAKGRILARPQDEAAASYFRTITRESGIIDWSEDAVLIWNKVRAYYPWPGCYTRWQGKNIKIIEAAPVAWQGNAAIGEVIALPHGGAGVVTGRGVLNIVTLQPEGKKPMPSAEFLRGQRQFIGSVLPS